TITRPSHLPFLPFYCNRHVIFFFIDRTTAFFLYSGSNVVILILHLKVYEEDNYRTPVYCKCRIGISPRRISDPHRKGRTVLYSAQQRKKHLYLPSKLYGF